MRLTSVIAPAMLVILITSGCQSPQAREASALKNGKKAFEKRDYQTAIIHFKNAAAARPKDAEPYYQLGRAYLASNDINLAAVNFKRATDLNPKHTGAQLEFSRLLASSRSEAMIVEAQKRAQDVLSLLPDDLQALNLLAFTELRLGKPETAEAHLEQALRKSPSDLKSSMTLAQTRLVRKDVAGAEQALKQAIAQAPKSAEAVVYLGGFYLAMGRTAEAEQQFRRALELDPKHGPALSSLAAMQVRAGQSAEAEQTYRRLSALPDKQYKPLHALFLFQSGRRDEALAELEKLAKEDPEDRDARTRLVAAYLALKRVGDAEKVLTAALTKNPRDVDALLQRSRIRLGNGKYDEATADLNQVLRFRNDPQAHYLLSKIHLARGKTAMRPQELGEALRADPGFLAARIELAQALIATRGADSALKLLDEAPQEQRGMAPVILQRNWALLVLGRREEARKGIDQALAIARSSDALVQDAVWKLDQKDYAKARSSAEEALKGDPGDTRALGALVQTYSAQKQTAAGIQKAREYGSQQPAAPAIQQFLGSLLLQNGDRAGARKAFEAAKAANPALVGADIALAQIDALEGRLDETRKRLSPVVAAHPDNMQARLFLAQTEFADGKSSAALEQYRKAVALNGKNGIAVNGLAYTLAENNQPDEALKYAQEAKELAPEDPAVDDTLGWTYFRKGMYSLAVKYLESANAREGTARRKYHLAMAYLKAGDPKRGRDTLTAAMKMDARLPEAGLARQLFGGSQ
ncbi:MAG: tetratricopeptide repeat protein [Acidobacteriia bacterium]|nr:tetratricopeptide repeat protein [Terriglobia bacterium]